jgi:uncharacterized protein YbbC (DUF1343 family)
MPTVKTGLDVLLARGARGLRGRRVALVTHQASVDSKLRHAAPLLRDARGFRLVALWAPEHGLWGAPQDHAHIRAASDPVTGLPVHSLYGERRIPTPAMLRAVDTIVIDLQDVGSRYYTFIWTTALVMRAAATAGKEVVVLDRPTPLGGVRVEGNVADPAWASFVGLYPLAIRHGMTIGEIAGYLNETHELGTRLTVIPMRGWRRAMSWEDTGLAFVPPSPNMPTPDTARVYPGGCLYEGTNLSEGRGTTRPFEWVGAPYLDAQRYADALERLRLPGVTFRPARFTPTFHKWAGRLCDGVQIHVTDVDRFKPYLTGLGVIAAARRLAPRAFAWRRPPYEFEHTKMPIDILCGTDAIRKAIERGMALGEIERRWSGGLAAWMRRRARYLLYR